MAGISLRSVALRPAGLSKSGVEELIAPHYDDDQADHRYFGTLAQLASGSVKLGDGQTVRATRGAMDLLNRDLFEGT